MISQSDFHKLEPGDLANYGVFRAKYAAFLAVKELWERRQKEGVKQADIARAINVNPAWVSRQLRGPANWTLRTLGALVEALDGELEIRICERNDKAKSSQNFDAYSEIHESSMIQEASLQNMPQQQNTPISRIWPD